jgi:hypothetical protein
MQFLGDIAFPLYLIHWPILILFKHFKLYSSLISALIYLFTIFLVAFILHLLVEQPAMRYDMERFRSNQRHTSSRSLSHFSKFLRKISIFISVVLVSSILFLSYPESSAKFFQQGESFFFKNRYSSQENTSQAKLNTQTSIEITPSNSKSTPAPTGVPLPTDSSVNSNHELLTPSSAPRALSTTSVGNSLVESEWMTSLKESSSLAFLPKSYSIDQRKVMAELKSSWSSGCLNSVSPESACAYGTGHREALLLGDSFAFSLLGGLKKVLPEGWTLRVLTKGSCLPWDLNQYGSNGELEKSCEEHSQWVNDYISKTKPDLIIATGADQWLQNSSIEDWTSGFKKSILFYQSRSQNVSIISSVPGSGDLLSCLGKDKSLKMCFGFPSATARFVKIQKSISATTNYNFLDLTPFLCFKDTCPAVINNIPVYGDGSHISAQFSIKLSDIFTTRKLFSLR